MTADPTIVLAVAGSGLLGLLVACHAALKGWTGWLDLQRAALDRRPRDAAPPAPIQRIEIADLKERIRKLEAIAAGVDF